jgi:hypothetical protein
MLPTKLWFIWPNGFRGEDLQKSPNQKQELLVAAIFVNGSGQNASYQVSVHLAEGFQRRRLKCETIMDDGRQVMAKAHLAFGKVS